MKRVLIIEGETAIAELEKDYLELSDFQVFGSAVPWHTNSTFIMR